MEYSWESHNQLARLCRAPWYWTIRSHERNTIESFTGFDRAQGAVHLRTDHVQQLGVEEL